MLAPRLSDFPRVRAHMYCACCGKTKPQSALLCWPCFNKNSLEGQIGSFAQYKIECTEANLKTSEHFDREFPKVAAVIEAIR